MVEHAKSTWMIVQVNSTNATIRFSVNHTLLLLLIPSFSCNCHWLNERLIKTSGNPWQNRAEHDINSVLEIVDCRSLTYCCAHTMGQPSCYRNRFLSSLSFFFLFPSANWLWRRSFAIPRTSRGISNVDEWETIFRCDLLPAKNILDEEFSFFERSTECRKCDDL